LKKRQRAAFHGLDLMLPEGAKLAEALLKWFDKHKRSFSFRWITDPYEVLVVEIMLRKTTARQVDKVWPRFRELFPTPWHLAEASLEEVEEVLAPLGLRRRAQQLQEIAKIIIEEWGGRVPKDPEKLKRLPGVGSYIAGCVASFCYNIKIPLIDSNVKRVLSRLLAKKLIGLSKANAFRLLCRAYLDVAPEQDLARFHYALLDLASKICKVKNPNCNNCPLKDWCSYYSLKIKNL